MSRCMSTREKKSTMKKKMTKKSKKGEMRRSVHEGIES